jgi:hypothetical protein
MLLTRVAVRVFLFLAVIVGLLLFYIPDKFQLIAVSSVRAHEPIEATPEESPTIEPPVCPHVERFVCPVVEQVKAELKEEPGSAYTPDPILAQGNVSIFVFRFRALSFLTLLLVTLIAETVYRQSKW